MTRAGELEKELRKSGKYFILAEILRIRLEEYGVQEKWREIFRKALEEGSGKVTYPLGLTMLKTVFVGAWGGVRALHKTAAASHMQHPIEGIYGEQRAELISQLRGDYNFGPAYFKRGVGSKEQPNMVPSAFENRLIGCICEPSQLYIHYMWLRKGFPRRCRCGYWFTLKDEE
ncbi:Cytochrome c oxidase subunit 5B, mitochondrial [Trichinella pseudospiralis]|uniref:Cytochrome c oxidase subunit 5B, mitochondrial n=1 Tax=Trichinella pseudospiralis TaxID=6337 RepID=A0A0V0Y535_TRIPS|nr:Cytochrome c oxidase subunit 5B, mitochondrial [Trichinella pseudospiralis]